MSYQNPIDDFRTTFGFIKPSWNPTRMLLRKRLTDKKIAKYQKLGYYDPAFQAARREMWDRREAKRTKRDGNFDLVDGRKIYRPT